MANDPDVRVFTADEAEEAARLVAEHDPATPRLQNLIPQDVTAASEAVHQLNLHLEGLPKFVQRAMEGAASSAGQLSDDRLQGLAELIQNADDLDATHASLAIDGHNSRLLFAHNGSGITFHDVLALAVPWLSLKTSEAEMVGRFGIGLKTLHSLSHVLEVHEGNFHLRLEAQTIAPLAASPCWPGRDTLPGGTLFAVPFDPGSIDTDDIAAWLARWGEAGLVFLRRLSTLTLHDSEGNETVQLRLTRGAPDNLAIGGRKTARRTVTASDGRQWTVYSRRAQAPQGQKRARKAHARLTPLAIAFPQFDGDSGHIHVGLPVRPIGLPFRVLAQFDPLANRRGINDTEWNIALIPLIAQLWSDAVVDLFKLNPSASWSVVPLRNEFAKDERTSHRLRQALETHLMTTARHRFAAQLFLNGGHGELLPLPQLAYEVPELEDILEPVDVQQVAGTEGAIAKAVRSADDRWRDVLDELNDLGAKTPAVVHIREALDLLHDRGRPPSFVAAITAVGLKADLGDLLWALPCLILETGASTSPDELGYLDVLLPEEVGGLWDTLGIGTRFHPYYRDVVGWPIVRDWLRHNAVLLTEATNYGALQVLAKAGRGGVELPTPLTDGQAQAIRAGIEEISEDDRWEVGPGIGKAVRLDVTTYHADGTRFASVACLKLFDGWLWPGWCRRLWSR